jgi:6-dehydroglucose reductase
LPGFYVHRPDQLEHPAELAATLDALVTSGKVGAIGLSNFSASAAAAVAAHSKAPLAAIQIELSAAYTAPFFEGQLDHAMQNGIAVAAWSPLAGGRLAHPNPEDQRLSAVATCLSDVAGRRGLTVAGAAIAFLLRHPAHITPILGTKNPERLAACAAALDCKLERSEWYAILEAGLGHKMP